MTTPPAHANRHCPCRQLWTDQAEAGQNLYERLHPAVPASEADLYGLTDDHLTDTAKPPRYQPHVYLVRDPDDSLTVTTAATRAALRPSTAVCHLSPGSSWPDGFYMDLLIGLGKDRDLVLAAQHDQTTDLKTHAWLWLRAHNIRHLIVLRADTIRDDLPALLAERDSNIVIWLVSTDAEQAGAPQRSRSPHPISAATFVEHWGCPHHDPAADSGPAESPPVAAWLPGIRLHTLRADLRRYLHPSGVDEHVQLLHLDLADARAMIAHLRTLGCAADLPAFGPSSGLSHDARREWMPDDQPLTDPASLAAALNNYFTADEAWQPLRRTLRLRALQLAFLEAGWSLITEEDRAPSHATSFGPILCADPDWARNINRLIDPQWAGYLALAYATGLPANALATIDHAAIRGDGGIILAEHRVWAIPAQASCFARALRLTGQPSPTAGQLSTKLPALAAYLALPKPPLPRTDNAGAHPWLASQKLTLTRLPHVITAEPDPIEFRLTHADRHSRVGAIEDAPTWR